MKLIAVVPILISFCFSFVATHYDAAYYGEPGDGEFKDYSDWMKKLDGDTLLSELALPGTHDSAAFTERAQAWYAFARVQTQARTFVEQMRDGIRFFDIRIRHTGNKFALHHADFYLEIMFGDFLNAVCNFLESNPSETILFRLKEDHKPDENNSRKLQETLETEYLNRGEYQRKYVNTNDLPWGPVKLKHVRGKFVIASNMLEFNSFGISYGDDFDKQDDYSSLDGKFEKIRAQIEKARKGDPEQFFINYLSVGAAWDQRPYKAASGPDGMNTLTRNYLRDHPRQFSNQRSVGIIMADFPGTDLIKYIINDNFQGNKKF